MGMLVGAAAPAIDRVNRECGRLIVVGDHKQLPPILKAEYPEVKPHELRLHGSILAALIRNVEERSMRPFSEDLGRMHMEREANENLFKLRENYRMNTALATFTESTYGDFQAQPGNANIRLQLQGRETWNRLNMDENEATVVREILTSEHAIVHLKLPCQDEYEGLSVEQTARAEAHVVAKLVKTYLENCTQETQEEKDRSIIVVTPHHVQRKALTRELEARAETLFINTAEKAQGKTALLVVICYTCLTEAQIERDAAFFLSHPRLNVAMSRARAKVVIVSGKSLKEIPLQMLRSDDTREGLRLFSHAIDVARIEEWPSELGVATAEMMEEADDDPQPSGSIIGLGSAIAEQPWRDLNEQELQEFETFQLAEAIRASLRSESI